MSHLSANLRKILAPFPEQNDVKYVCRCLIAGRPIDTVYPIKPVYPSFRSFEDFYQSRRVNNLVYYALLVEKDPFDFFNHMQHPDQDTFQSLPVPFEPSTIFTFDMNRRLIEEKIGCPEGISVSFSSVKMMKAVREYLNRANCCFANRFNSNHRFFVVDRQQLDHLTIYVNNRCNWIIGDKLIESTTPFGLHWLPHGEVWIVIDKYDQCPPDYLNYVWTEAKERGLTMSPYQSRKVEYLINRSCPHRLGYTCPDGSFLVEGFDLLNRIKGSGMNLPPRSDDEKYEVFDTNIADAFFVFLSQDYGEFTPPPIDEFLMDYSLESRQKLADEIIHSANRFSEWICSSNVPTNVRDVLGRISKMQGRFDKISRLVDSESTTLLPVHAQSLLIWASVTMAVATHDPQYPCLQDTQSLITPPSTPS